MGLSGWCCGAMWSGGHPADTAPWFAAMDPARDCVLAIEKAIEPGQSTGDRIATMAAAFLRCGAGARRVVSKACESGQLSAECGLCRAVVRSRMPPAKEKPPSLGESRDGG